MSPFIWAVNHHLGEFDLVHVHSYIYFLANQVAFLRLLRHFPYILHLHGGLDYIPPNVLGYPACFMKIFYDATVGRLTIRTADRVISCCETDRLKSIHMFGVDPDKIISIPNCIDSSQFRLSQAHNPVNITFIGRLSELKGCHQFPYFMENLNKNYRNIKFTFVGNGPLSGPLSSFCKRKGYSATFTGVVPNREIPDILAKSSILVLPSFTEGFPLVCLEALASGVPVVAYDVGGIKEVVRNNETGYTIPLNDKKKFLDGISWLVDNEEERVKMGKRGRSIIQENYDWEVAVPKIEKIYEEMVGNG